MNDNLSQLTEAELSEVFAVALAGWRNDPQEGWYDENGFSRTWPDFATDANAVLPWLYKRHWRVDQTSEDYTPIRVVLDHEHGPSGKSTTFPRAACIALIRAKRAEKQ